MDTRGELDRPNFSLATAPATPWQTRLAFSIVAVLFVAFAVAAPFAATPLPRIHAFIPTIAAIVFVTDLITAVLLFGQFWMIRTVALLVLASGYLFTALVSLCLSEGSRDLCEPTFSAIGNRLECGYCRYFGMRTHMGPLRSR